MIGINVVYSFVLLFTCMVLAIGVSTYQWVETTVEQMEKASIVIPPNAPGLQKVSCGLYSYCIDAAGEVAECTLPWPQYGSGPSDIPIMWWKVAAGFITTGILFEVICWLYTLLACFGCFRTKWQKCSSKMASCSGLFVVIGLLAWAAGFGDMAVNECTEAGGEFPNDCIEGYHPVFPSSLIEGGDDKIGCRICSHNTQAFAPSVDCEIGFGAIFVCVGCFLSLISGCIGNCVESREYARGDIV
jgi:hypothetical protein